MGRAYSLDLRERVVATVAAVESCRAVASTFLAALRRDRIDSCVINYFANAEYAST